MDSIGGVWVGFSLWMGYSQYLKQEDIREDMAPLTDHFEGVWHLHDGKTWLVMDRANGLVDNEIRALAVGEGWQCVARFLQKRRF